jgi:hypothetical protein
MSTNGGIEVLEEMILGKAETVEHSHKYKIFLTGDNTEESLKPSFLIELLLLFDSGVFDLDTLSKLFDVSVQDIVLFTEDYPGYWDSWDESVATMWTKSLKFYEEDIEDLAWIAKYAIKRAEMAVAMEKTLMEATSEMSKELEEDDGWTEDTLFMRLEGQEDQSRRIVIMSGWFCRSEIGGEDAEYATT